MVLTRGTRRPGLPGISLMQFANDNVLAAITLKLVNYYDGLDSEAQAKLFDMMDNHQLEDCGSPNVSWLNAYELIGSGNTTETWNELVLCVLEFEQYYLDALLNCPPT